MKERIEINGVEIGKIGKDNHGKWFYYFLDENYCRGSYKTKRLCKERMLIRAKYIRDMLNLACNGL